MSGVDTAACTGRYRYSDYGKGSVIKVKLHNFMTYKDAILEPGPRLNLVLGPNGTGKSSFVCALCLGLAGSTTLLGRADIVKDFIRRGETEALVEITLASGQAKPIVVSRRIKTAQDSGGTSDWKLNGQTVVMRDVKEKMKELNVQLDNLCQFLPQDKVVEFARLSPVELLRETQKAIGDSRLADLHKKLIEENVKCNSSARERASVANELLHQQGVNDRAKRDVERFKNREQLLAKIELIEKKLPWIHYTDALNLFVEAKSKMRNAEESLAQREQDFRDSQEPLRLKAAEMEKARAAVEPLSKKCKSHDAQIDKLPSSTHELQSKLEEKRRELANLDQKARDAKAKVKKAEDELATAAAELESLPPPPQGNEEKKKVLQAQWKELDVQNRGIDTGIRDKQEELRQHEDELRRAKGRLSQIDNIKSQRLDTLSRILRCGDGMRKAYDWVAQTQQAGRFRGPVFGPILLEVECQDQQHTRYLESQVPMSVWQRFVTVFREDQDLINNHFASQPGSGHGRPFCPIVSNYTGNPQTVITHPKGEAQKYASYGITHTLDQVFAAPPVVKHVMTDEANLNEAYAGTQYTQSVVEKCLQENPQLANLWTPESNYSVRTSMYNKDARSQSVAPVMQRNLISGGANSQERDKLQNECNRIAQVIDAMKPEIQEQLAVQRGNSERMDKFMQEQKRLSKEVQDAADNRQIKATKLTYKQGVLDKARKQPDPRQKAPELQRAIQKCSQDILKMMQSGTALFQQFLITQKAYCVAELHHREMAMQHAALKNASSSNEQEYRSYQEAVKRLKATVAQRRDIVKRLKAEAEEKTNGQPDEELQQAFCALSGKLEELQTEMVRLRAEAEGIACANPRVLQEYQERQKKIAEMEAKLQSQDDELATQQERIKTLHDQWYPDLLSTVKKINQTFQRNFKDIGCAGEVSLAEHPDYDKFAVQIKVKFRDDEDLQVLTASRQSGGERSVSTILYLISIQDVTVCPFRVVDEINQGMDPINERKVFMQLVESACRPGTPQCFLLTPKLLPALPFTAAVQVLQIWNGPTIKQLVGSFDQAKVLGTRKRIRGYAG
ncbi:hypothetical protein ABBQ38_008351 [Trebouxia sp. C0009 RCD-2024]